MTLAVALLGTTAGSIIPAVSQPTIVSAKAKKKHYKLPKYIQKELAFCPSKKIARQWDAEDLFTKKVIKSKIKELAKYYKPNMTNGKHGKTYYYQGLPEAGYWVTEQSFHKTATTKDIAHLQSMADMGGTQWLKEPIYFYSYVGQDTYSFTGTRVPDAGTSGNIEIIGTKDISNKQYAIMPNNDGKMLLVPIEAITAPMYLYRLKSDSKNVQTYAINEDEQGNRQAVKHTDGDFDGEGSSVKIGHSGSINLNITHPDIINGEKYYAMTTYDGASSMGLENSKYWSVAVKASDLDKFQHSNKKFNLNIFGEDTGYLIPDQSDLTKPATLKQNDKYQIGD